MQNKLILLLLAVVLLGCGGSRKANDEAGLESELLEIRYEYGLPIDSFRVVEDCIGRGETLGKLLTELGAPQKVVGQLSLIKKAEFDPSRMRAGDEYIALYDTLGAGQAVRERLAYFIYKASIIETYVLDLRDTLHVEKQVKEVRHEKQVGRAVIESSLWNAMVDNGMPAELAVSMSDIYAWTIDFFGLQKGDSICVYYENMYVDTISIGVGRIFAAHFFHAGNNYQAYFLDNDEVQGYFDEKGVSLRKAFLKAPLNYRRISSTFTYHRRHPIFKTVRPHTGVDYAAPAGTPVVSIGNGKVIEKGYKGGGGHTVKIRHNATYTTAYLHLKGYVKGLSVGQRVSQGQLIGYVGSTGNSTGPHLDFRIWKNGTPIDPLKMQSPPADPVPSKYMATYKQTVDSIQKILN